MIYPTDCIPTQSLFRAVLLAVPLVLLVGCASLGTSKNWRADVFDQQTLVMLAQLGLRSEGFDPGQVDGLKGSRTHAAAAAFRRDRGLPLSDHIDAELIESIYHDHGFEKPMPYVEGSIRSCFRWGPSRVLIMASNLGIVTCTVGARSTVSPSEIALAEKFCLDRVPLRSELVKCELIFDGQRILNHHKLIQLLNADSAPLPVLVRTEDVSSRQKSQTNATLQAESRMYRFNPSAFYMKGPEVLRVPLRARIAGVWGRTICEGNVIPSDSRAVSYDMVCFGNTPMQGEARMVGVVPVGGLLLPAYETSAHYSNFWISIIAPDNTIRFD